MIYGVFLINFWIGVIVEKQKIRFLRNKDWRKIAGSGLAGLVGFIALRKGLPALYIALGLEGTIFRLSQILILSFYVTALAPWIFQILKLCDKDKAREL